MRKMWNEPMMEQLSIKATAGGGAAPTTHDGVYTSYNGQYWEGFNSGKED